MAKNRNPSNRNNEERTGSNQGNDAIERNEQPGRKAADRGTESSRQGSSERDSSRKQPNRQQGGEKDAGSSRSSESNRQASGRESGRQGSNNPEKGRQSRELEGQDVDQLDEERENI